MISGRDLLEKIVEFKTLGNSALMKLPEVTFFPLSPGSDFILHFFEKGCFRAVTGYTGLSAAVLYQIGSDAVRQRPDLYCAGMVRV